MCENPVAMIRVRAIATGLLFAIVAVVLALLILIAGEALYWRLVVLPRFQSGAEGGIGGGTVAAINVAEILAVAAVAFVVGVWWKLRRAPA